MEMTTSRGRRRPRRIETPTILTHSAQVSSVLARAGCTRTCPVVGPRATSCGLSYHHRFRPADILHTVEARATPRPACGAGSPEGRLTNISPHGSRDPQIARTG